MKIAEVAFTATQIGEALAEYAQRRKLVELPNGDARLEWRVHPGTPTIVISMEFHTDEPKGGG